MSKPLDESTPSIEYSLLGLLDVRPMHGYDLHRELSQKTGLGLIWTVKKAQLYSILAKLESESLIEARVEVEGNRPARRVFHPTKEGKKAYRAWLRSPATRRNFRLDFPAKLFFAKAEGPEASKALLDAQRGLCERWLDEMRERREACGEGGLDALVYGYRIGQLEATLAWLGDCGAALGSRRVDRGSRRAARTRKADIRSDT